MGWEQRGSQYYYYKKEREGSRVKSIYVGRGEVAQMISQLQTAFGPLEKFVSLRTDARLAELQNGDDVIDQLCSTIDLIKQACLLRAGFHLHNRQWRKRRDGHNSRVSRKAGAPS
jgi:hypothetical protein